MSTSALKIPAPSADQQRSTKEFPVDHDTHFPTDPRDLSLSERHEWCRRLQPQHQLWQRRLQVLAEPRPAADFPAFLLATPPLRQLAERIGDSQRRVDLNTGVADEVDRFVDAYRDYLRTCAGEDVFGSRSRRAS
jgi:hypothetical protein